MNHAYPVNTESSDPAGWFAVGIAETQAHAAWPEYETDHQPDHSMGVYNLLATGYAPDGEHKLTHQGRVSETLTVSRGNLTCTGSYPNAPFCGNRIGMVGSTLNGYNFSFLILGYDQNI